MKGTFNIQGHKVRIASQRRYILLWWSDYAERWVIDRRSDTRAKLEKLRKGPGDVILDTVTGEVR